MYFFFFFFFYLFFFIGGGGGGGGGGGYTPGENFIDSTRRKLWFLCSKKRNKLFVSFLPPPPPLADRNLHTSGLTISKYKVGVIIDPLGQTHSLASSEHCFDFVLFLLNFEKYGRTGGRHVRKQWSLPAMTLGWPSGSTGCNAS